MTAVTTERQVLEASQASVCATHGYPARPILVFPNSPVRLLRIGLTITSLVARMGGECLQSVWRKMILRVYECTMLASGVIAHGLIITSLIAEIFSFS